MAKRWTKRERNVLLRGVSIHGLAWLHGRTGDSYDWPNAPTGRSRNSIYAQAREMCGRGGLTRGAYTLRQVCEMTGYSKTQIRRAQRALGQKWKRTSARGSHLIQEDQMQEIAQWLRNDYWCKHLRLYNCIWCGTDDRGHHAVGLCKLCHKRYKTRLERRGLPSQRSDLLALVRGMARMLGEFPVGIERQLVMGRALTENMLRQLIRIVRLATP